MGGERGLSLAQLIVWDADPDTFNFTVLENAISGPIDDDTVISGSSEDDTIDDTVKEWLIKTKEEWYKPITHETTFIDAPISRPM